MEFSFSNHFVARIGDNRWIKVASSQEQWATEAIIYDGMIQKNFGRDIRFCHYDNKIAMTMPDLGDVYTGIPVEEYVSIIESIRNIESPIWVTRANKYVQRAASRASDRIEGVSERVFEWCNNVFESLDEKHLEGNTLAHTDLHEKNILKKTDTSTGKTVTSVIDWESAVVGSKEIDVANCYHSILVAEPRRDSKEAHKLLGMVEDEKAFETALKNKAASATSYILSNKIHQGYSVEEAVEITVERTNYVGDNLRSIGIDIDRV